MAKKSKTRARRVARARRHSRVVKKVRGTAERPRLVVHRSLRNIEGQIVDDDRGMTLLGVSSLTAGDAPDMEDAENMTSKVAASYAAGMALAEKARERGIERIVFDRGGYLYHGRVRAFAEGARAGGLDF
jgi:large subunit ribosomal protein L18